MFYKNPKKGGGCITLTNRNLMHNADGEPDGEGGTLAIPMTGGYSDGELSPGEYVDVRFNICLTKWKWFRFFVDVWGVPNSQGINCKMFISICKRSGHRAWPYLFIFHPQTTHHQ